MNDQQLPNLFTKLEAVFEEFGIQGISGIVFFNGGDSCYTFGAAEPSNPEVKAKTDACKYVLDRFSERAFGAVHRSSNNWTSDK